MDYFTLDNDHSDSPTRLFAFLQLPDKLLLHLGTDFRPPSRLWLARFGTSRLSSSAAYGSARQASLPQALWWISGSYQLLFVHDNLAGFSSLQA